MASVALVASGIGARASWQPSRAGGREIASPNFQISAPSEGVDPTDFCNKIGHERLLRLDGEKFRSTCISGLAAKPVLLRLEADCVEKVLAAVEANFLRAADASSAVRYGGPHQLEQRLSASFYFASGMHPPKKSAADKLLRGFFLGSTFDFFNRIGQKPTLPPLTRPTAAAATVLRVNALPI